MPQVISRKDAGAQNALRFFTGKSCINGHLSERYVSTGSCIECLRPAVHERVPRPASARRIAKESGALTYQADKPCMHGHAPIRYASTGQCVACTRTPDLGTTTATLRGSNATMEQVLEYHAYLVSIEPNPLTTDFMVGGPRLAARNLARHINRKPRKPSEFMK
jgi:hypothetical protein